MTPEEIQQARRDAEYLVTLHEANDTAVGRLARAFVVLTEQQPEPADLDEGGSERQEFTLNLAKHYLSGELDVDRNDRCVCGVGFGDPSVCPGWDDHIADVAFDWLLSRYTITRKPQEIADVV